MNWRPRVRERHQSPVIRETQVCQGRLQPHSYDTTVEPQDTVTLPGPWRAHKKKSLIVQSSWTRQLLCWSQKPA